MSHSSVTSHIDGVQKLIVLAIFCIFCTTTAFAQDDAKGIAQFVPSKMEAGKKYTVVVQFENTGNSSWSNQEGYRLGPQNPTDNSFWDVNKVKMTAKGRVSPGKTATFKFSVTAPSKEGVYDFQWQMRHLSRGWFGKRGPNTKVEVESSKTKNNSVFVLQEFPGLVTVGPPFAVLNIGQNFEVKIILKNSGSSVWTSGLYKLGSQTPENNLTWLVDGVELNTNDVIQTGQFKTFTFIAVAPSEPGIYDFQWQLYQKGSGWFGALTPLVKITVH
jgi:hypothetical protein